MKYNATQMLVAEITGYCPFDDENGAKNDAYYDAEPLDGKIRFLLEFITEGDFQPWHQKADVGEAYYFIEGDFENSNDRYYAFTKLSELP